MKKGKKRYSLVYRRCYPFDTREYNKNRFIQNPLAILASECLPDNETVRRIKPIKRGRFVYVPSPEYLERKKSGIWVRDPLIEE